jgi:hypothetical protein
MKKIVIRPLIQILILWTLVLTIAGCLYIFAIVLNLQNNLDMYLSLLIGSFVYIGCQKLFLDRNINHPKYNKILVTITSLVVIAVYMLCIYLRLLNIEF